MSTNKAGILIASTPYSVTECEKHPDYLFVFGDNAKRTGKGGQAIIRDCPNSFGIATKWIPDNGPTSFFDYYPFDAYILIQKDLNILNKIYMSNKYKYIIFPINGIGTGLAQLPISNPSLFRYLCARLQKYFGIITEKDEKGYHLTME